MFSNWIIMRVFSYWSMSGGAIRLTGSTMLIGAYLLIGFSGDLAPHSSSQPDTAYAIEESGPSVEGGTGLSFLSHSRCGIYRGTGMLMDQRSAAISCSATNNAP